MFSCRLDEYIFEVVKNGTKNVEVRVNDEKRRKMKIGDELVFLKRPLEEEQEKYGVVAIEFKKVK